MRSTLSKFYEIKHSEEIFLISILVSISKANTKMKLALKMSRTILNMNSSSLKLYHGSSSLVSKTILDGGEEKLTPKCKALN